LHLRPRAGTRAPRSPHLPAAGWNNVGFHARDQPNAQEIVTPHMDDLAANGVILDRHYVFRFCSPSRSSFQTGRNPIHVNTGNDYLTLVNKQDPVAGFAGIPRNMTVLAEKLAAAGYATAQAGKWRVRARARARAQPLAPPPPRAPTPC
jgi:arylsulfatase I/J